MQTRIQPSTVAAGARAVLAAATKLFARDGFDGVSMADIAQEAGVCKANIFHHFASKQELYLEVIRQVSNTHADYAEAVLEQPGSCADKLRKLVEFEVKFLLEDEARSRLMLREADAGSSSTVRGLVFRTYERNLSLTMRVFEEGRRRGEFSDSFDPVIVASLLSAAGHFYFRSRQMMATISGTDQLQSAEDYVERVSAVLLSGILARPASDAAETTPDQKHA